LLSLGRLKPDHHTIQNAVFFIFFLSLFKIMSLGPTGQSSKPIPASSLLGVAPKRMTALPRSKSMLVPKRKLSSDNPALVQRSMAPSQAVAASARIAAALVLSDTPTKPKLDSKTTLRRNVSIAAILVLLVGHVVLRQLDIFVPIPHYWAGKQPTRKFFLQNSVFG
jgi:hypothetical protein